MSVNILMPALSPTMTEGKIARWLKAEGEMVKSGQVLCEIETDKATMEVEAVDEGRLAKILVPAGTEGVKVNTPIAVIAGRARMPPPRRQLPSSWPRPRSSRPRRQHNPSLRRWPRKEPTTVMSR